MVAWWSEVSTIAPDAWHADADVVFVDAGLQGLAWAIDLSRAGLRVVMLEAVPGAERGASFGRRRPPPNGGLAMRAGQNGVEMLAADDLGPIPEAEVLGSRVSLDRLLDMAHAAGIEVFENNASISWSKGEKPKLRVRPLARGTGDTMCILGPIEWCGSEA